MIEEGDSLQVSNEDAQSISTRCQRKWLIIYNLGFFLIFLGLFNPLLWVSVQSGNDPGIVLMNGLYTVLLVAFGIMVMLFGRRLAKRPKGKCDRQQVASNWKETIHE